MFSQHAAKHWMLWAGNGCQLMQKSLLSPVWQLVACKLNQGGCQPHAHTAKIKCRKFETNIPRKGISGPQSQFPYSCELWANYIFPQWVCLFCWRKYVDWSWEYINGSRTHECGNCGWGRAIPRKGIYKRNCRCSALSLNLLTLHMAGCLPWFNDWDGPFDDKNQLHSCNNALIPSLKLISW